MLAEKWSCHIKACAVHHRSGLKKITCAKSSHTVSKLSLVSCVRAVCVCVCVCVRVFVCIVQFAYVRKKLPDKAIWWGGDWLRRGMPHDLGNVCWGSQPLLFAPIQANLKENLKMHVHGWFWLALEGPCNAHAKACCLLAWIKEVSQLSNEKSWCAGCNGITLVLSKYFSFIQRRNDCMKKRK